MSGLISNKWFVIAILLFIAFFSLLLFAISISPITPFEGYDSCVFKQMGTAYLQGKVPYLDLFDHKGPVLLLINALGLTLSAGRWGLFSLALTNMTLVLYMWYKTSKLYAEDAYALMPVLVALISYLGCMEEGNLTEDWSLFPNSYTLYLLAKYIKKDKPINILEYVFVGILTGCIIFIRANNISVIVCCALYLSYILIKKGNWVSIVKAYTSVIVGILITSILVVCLFYVKYGEIGVKQMLFGTFGFNFMYAGFNSYYDFIVSSLYNHAYFLGAIMLVTFAYINNKGKANNKEFSIFLFFSFLLCFYAMGTASFRHYMINVVPLFLVSSVYAFRNSYKPYVVFISVALLAFEPFFKRQLQFSLGQAKREYAKMYDDGTILINQMTPFEKRHIWNYNAEMAGIGLLQHNQLVQSNRVVLNFQRDISPELALSENGKIQKKVPKYILVDPTKGFVLPEDSLFITQNYMIERELHIDVSSKNVEEHKSINIMKNKHL